MDREAQRRAVEELRLHGDYETADLLEIRSNPHKLWEAIGERLRSCLTPAELEEYLAPSHGWRLEDTLLTVQVRDDTAKRWWLERFGREFRGILSDLGLAYTNIQFVAAEPTPRTLDSLPTIHIGRALERWKSELLDLSHRNALLYAKPGRTMLLLALPASTLLFDKMVNSQRPFTIYQRLAANSPFDGPFTMELALRDGILTEVYRFPDEETEEGPADLPRKDEIVILGDAKKTLSSLYRLRLRARTALQEQGTGVLYLAFGMLEWREARTPGTPVQSPILLQAVRLEQETALAPYKLTPLDEEVVLNPALVRKLAVDFNIQLDVLSDDEGGQNDGLTHLLDRVSEVVAGRKEWTVRPDAYLGLFSFAKHSLYADLEQNSDRFLRHPVLRVLSGEVLHVPAPPPSTPTAAQLEEERAPEATFQVLDADASQQEAIAAVLSGANVVIHGPPGTGKSQTITNIIAEMLAEGKKVLFVSEKMAALRVVAKRLEEAGLAEFCLEAHSQDLQKERVIRDLHRVLSAEDLGGAPDSTRTTADFMRLKLIRRDLNAYVRALHDRSTPLGLSAFDVHGHLAQSTAPLVPFDLPGLETLTPQDLSGLEGVVRDLVAVGHVLLAGREHPWFGSTHAAYTPQLQAMLADRLERLTAEAERLDEAQRAVRQSFDLPGGSMLGDATWLAELLALLRACTPVPRGWWTMPTVAPLMEQAQRYEGEQTEFRATREALLHRYTPALFDLDLPPIIRGLHAADENNCAIVRGRGTPATRATLVSREIGGAVDGLDRALRTLHERLHTLADLFGLAPPWTLAQASDSVSLARLVLSDPQPLRVWFDRSVLPGLQRLAEQAAEQQAVLRSLLPELEQRFTGTLFGLATQELLGELENEYSSWSRNVKPGYRRIVKVMRRALRKSGDLSYEDIVEAVRDACQVNATRSWFADHEERLVTTFGPHYTDYDTDWRAVGQALACTEVIDDHFGPGGVPSSLQQLLLGGHTSMDRFRLTVTALKAATDDAEAALGGLDSLVDVDALAGHALGPAHVPFDHLLAAIHGWTSTLDPFWSALAAVRACLRSADDEPGIEMLLADVARAQATVDTERDIAARQEQLSGLFGNLYTGIHTDWTSVLEALRSTEAILRHLRGTPSPSLIRVIEANRVPDDALYRDYPGLLQDFEQTNGRVGEDFQVDTYPPDRGGDGALTLREIAFWARRQRTALPLLEEWCDLRAVREHAEEIGLTGFLEALVIRRPPVSDWEAAFNRQLYTQWLTWRYQTSEVLERFRAQRHEDLIAEFRRLDRWQWQAASHRIAQRVRKHRPRLGETVHRDSEPGILLREASKRKRFRPLRKLFADLPSLLPRLKPCLLMSPMSVAQYLGDSPIEFDLVIFDEASQILPADAVGAMGRAKQLVVVGDQRQLPPTQFFTVTLQESDDEEDEEELPESILDTCLAAGMSSKSLLWHYRSRHEGLIAFSNQHFYDDALVTFPSVTANLRAVEYVYVPDGVFTSGRARVNVPEAKRVVDLVIAQVRRQPERSIGVITFSQAQMEEVQREVDARKRRDPGLEEILREDGSEGFFVKNLENVQGDERDIIFFSVGYGPDENGKMSMNFGPLNKQGGERRLNVAITRARLHVTIVASFHPYDIDLNRAKSRGARLLRDYLEYAERGPRSLAGGARVGDGQPASRFEEALAQGLSTHGFATTPQVGIGGYRIDLGVLGSDPDGYVLGIESDGAAYASAQTARDRDRLRGEVLARLGWKTYRAWSTEWIKDPASSLQHLAARIDEARSSQSGESLAAGVDATSDAEVELGADEEPGDEVLHPQAEDVDTAGFTAPIDAADSVEVTIPRPIPWEPSAESGLDFAEPYRHADLPVDRYTRDALPLTPARLLADLVVTCVEVEGPVHVDRVMRAVAHVFGVKRLSKGSRPEVERGIHAALDSGSIVQLGDFLWPAGMQVPPVRSADADGNVRGIQEVAPEELETAVLIVLCESFALAEKDLISAVARGMGYDRTGSLVSPAIADAIQRLLETGQAMQVGEQISAAA